MAILKLNNNSLTNVTELPSGVGSDPNTKVSLARLGLRVFANQNLATSNTQNLSYDVFQDSTGIQNLTNTQRNDSEFVSSVSQSDTDSVTINASNYQSWFDWNNVNKISVRKNSSGVSDFYNPTASTNATFNGSYTDISSDDTIDDSELDDMVTALFTANSSDQVFTLNNNDTSGSGGNRIMHFNIGMQANKSFKPTSFSFRWRNGSGSHGDTQLHGSNSATGSYAGTFLATMRSGSISNGSTYTGSFSNTNFYDVFTIRTYHTGNNSIFYDSLALTGTTRALTTSATGSFEGVDVTAPSSVSKMGAVITYEETGTNVLNTDLVMKLSADSGSNFTTATLEALPDFASGVKCAKISDVSVTPGTACTYQINFANQSDGVKTANITGGALTF